MERVTLLPGHGLGRHRGHRHVDGVPEEEHEALFDFVESYRAMATNTLVKRLDAETDRPV